MANTTFQGVVRSYGGGGKGIVTPGVMTQTVQFACDPTATGATNVRIGTDSSAGQTLTLPAGAIILSVQTVQAAAGGTNPTIDLGTSADDNGIADELPVDTKGEITGAAGALIVAGGLAANATVTAKVGASAATSGTFVGALTYAMANNGAE
tara:strand:+ start:1202 stop:1657 length:456 start_codon:yes stop_codon:yes gene_type:complete